MIDGVVFEALPISVGNGKPAELEVRDDLGGLKDGKNELWLGLDKDARPSVLAARIVFPAERFGGGPTNVIVRCASRWAEGPTLEAYDASGSLVATAKHSGTPERLETLELSGGPICRVDIKGAVVAVVDVCYEGVAAATAATIAEQAQGKVSTNPCDCDPCTSALSPNAYFVDLLGFIADSLQVSVQWIEGRLRQPLASMPMNCASAEDRYPQIRFANEALVNFIAERRATNWRLLSEEQLDAIYDECRTLPTDVTSLLDWIIAHRGRDPRVVTDEDRDGYYAEFSSYILQLGLTPNAVDEAFSSILREFGADRPTVQAALSASEEERDALAESLGIEASDLGILGTSAEDVKYSDLGRAFSLLHTAKTTLLFRALRANLYREKLSERLDELSAEMEQGVSDAPETPEEARAVAQEFAESAASAVEAELRSTAEADAKQQVTEARERIDAVFLQKARANLMFVAHNEVRLHGTTLPEIASAAALGDYLHVDLSVDVCHKTTRVAFSIETLQDLVSAFQLGYEESVPAAARVNPSRWAWMKSFGIWHAVQTVFLYPDAFVFPEIRRLGTSWDGSGWSQAFDELVEYVEQQPSLNLRTAQAALDHFADRLRDLADIEITHTAETDRLYLFCANTSPERAARLTRLYYSTLDSAGTWSGWRPVDLAGHKLRASTVDGRCIQDVVVVDGRVRIFLLEEEKRQAIVIAQDETGAFQSPEPLPDENISHLRAVVIRPRTAPVGGVPRARVLAFYPSSEGDGKYSVIKMDESIEKLGAAIRVPPKSTLVAATAFSGLAGSRSTAVLEAIHAASSPGDTVYSPVLFAVSTAAEAAVQHVLYGDVYGDDYLWARLQSASDSGSAEPALDLTTTLRWKTPRLSTQAPALGYHRARLFVRWASSSEFASIGAAAGFIFFDGERTIHYLSWNLAPTGSQNLQAEPMPTSVTMDTIGFMRGVTYVHADDVLYRRSAGPIAEVVGQLTLAAPHALHPLEINVGRRPVVRANSSASQPVDTRDGRQYFKAVQALQFAHFRYPGYAQLYLEEFFFHAPLYLAALLNEAERYPDATKVLAAVVQPFLTFEEDDEDTEYVQNVLDEIGEATLPTRHPTVSHRFLFIGFHQEDIDGGPQLEYRGSENFLDSPLDPHELARHRPLTYARQAVQMYLDNLLDWADAEFSRDTPESVARARELYESAGKVIALEDLPGDLCAIGYGDVTLPAAALGPRAGYVNAITRPFCIPRSPIWDVLRFRVDSNLQKIRTCRNVAGVKRALQTYATPVDATALVEAAASGVALDDFVPVEPPPLYRYGVLIERARHLTQIASHLESYFLSVLEKLDEEEYSLLRARSDLRLSVENVSLQSLQVRRANESVQLAHLQQDRAEKTWKHYDNLIRDGWSALEILAVGGMFAAAALHGVAAYAYGLARPGEAASAGAALLQTASGALQTWAAFDRREQEWNYQFLVADKDLEIAKQGVTIVKTEVEIREKERDIALLSSTLAVDTIEFLANRQFTNAALYRWMSKELRKLYRKQLHMAHSIARAAQQALAFELQEALNFIGLEYGDVKREGLLGAEKLTVDIEKLEQHRIARAERRREVTEVLSLASQMPGEFQRFKRTGVLEFATPSAVFDRRGPGEYRRLIKSVEVSVFALVPPSRGIRATLTNHGISRVMTGPPFAEPTVVQRPPEVVTLSSPIAASGLFELRLDDPMLLPFEGSGVDTMWTLEMLPGANDFDFDTIADILMTVRYTAREDWGYRQKVISALQEGYTNTAAASVRNAFPDSWYDFHNPRFGGPYGLDGTAPLPPYSVRLTLKRDDFPPNESNRRIKRVLIAGDLTREMRVPIYVVFQPESGVPVEAHGKELVDGRTTLMEFGGKEPYGSWVVVVDTTADEALYEELFEGASAVGSEKKIQTEVFRDLLLVIEYSAELRY